MKTDDYVRLIHDYLEKMPVCLDADFGKLTIGQALVNGNNFLADWDKFKSIFGPNSLIVYPCILSCFIMAKALEDMGVLDLQKCVNLAEANHAHSVGIGERPENIEIVPFYRS